MEEIGGVWRTVSERRIFIKEGQSLTDAMKESGKFSKENDLEFTDTGAIKVKDEKERNKIIEDIYKKYDDNALKKY